MDEISIRGLRVTTLIGLRAWERSVRQLVLIDLTMRIDAAAAAATDTLDQAVDYGSVARRVATFVGESRVQLIETLAERIAALVLSEFAVASVRVCVHKPNAVPNAATTSVEIERRRD